MVIMVGLRLFTSLLLMEYYRYMFIGNIFVHNKSHSPYG